MPDNSSGKTIPLLKPSLPTTEHLLKYLKEIDSSARFTNFGPINQLLENRLATLLHSPNVVCTSSGTLALEASLIALDIKPGRGVAVPAITFPATATAVLRSGLQPIICDIDPNTCLLTPESVLEASKHYDIAAAIPVCLYGRSQNVDGWRSLHNKTGIEIIIDAAGAIGYQQAAAELTTIYSLHATKPVSSAEGGCIATFDSILAARIRSTSNFGFSEGVTSIVGTNAKLSEYHAAVGLASLDLWSEQRLKRKKLLEDYFSIFSDTGADKVAPIFNGDGVSSEITIKPVRGVTKDDLRRFDARGIETRQWYTPPIHHHPAFELCHRMNDLTNSENLSNHLLGLPFHLYLSTQDIHRIAESVNECFE